MLLKTTGKDNRTESAFIRMTVKGYR